MYAKSTKQILSKIGCSKLDLVKGCGYWYFVYDDLVTNIYETESVCVARLKHLRLSSWVNIGKEFAAKCEERKERCS